MLHQIPTITEYEFKTRKLQITFAVEEQTLVLVRIVVELWRPSGHHTRTRRCFLEVNTSVIP